MCAGTRLVNSLTPENCSVAAINGNLATINLIQVGNCRIDAICGEAHIEQPLPVVEKRDPQPLPTVVDNGGVGQPIEIPAPVEALCKYAPMTLTSLTPEICSITAQKINLLSAGTCKVAVDRAATTNCNAKHEEIAIQVHQVIPGAPTEVTATASNASATVSFASPANNGGSAITGYTVTATPVGGSAITKTGMSSPITVTGLTNGIAYTFTVTATNAIGTGTASAASSSVTPVTVPSVPTRVSATPGNNRATVSFTTPASNGGSTITGYTVIATPVGGGSTITANGTSSPIIIIGLINGVAYTFTVTATNAIGTGTASAASSNVTADATLEISPILLLFPKTNPNATSASQIFTITNKANSPRMISFVTLGGTNSSEFSVSANTCTNQTLTAGASCTASLAFSPQGFGPKTALLLINTNDPQTPTLAGTMTNFEDIPTQVRRRIPPVLAAVKVYLTADTNKIAVTQLTKSLNYTVEWTVEGYDTDYFILPAVFNCSLATPGECGSSYNSASGLISSTSYLSKTSTNSSVFTYSGQTATKFNYSYSFNAPATAGNSVVLRFYQKTLNDQTIGNSGVSVLVPGNLGIGYFDNQGRRLSLNVVN